MTKRKSDSHKRIIFKAFLIIALCMLIPVAIALPGREKNLHLQEEKKRVANQYFQLIADGNYTEAYKLKSVVYTRTHTLADFQKHISSHPSWYQNYSRLDNFKFVYLGKAKKWTNCSAYGATAHYKDGTTGQLRMKGRPSKDGNSWMVIDETISLSEERKTLYKDYASLTYIRCTEEDNQ